MGLAYISRGAIASLQLPNVRAHVGRQRDGKGIHPRRQSSSSSSAACMPALTWAIASTGPGSMP